MSEGRLIAPTIDRYSSGEPFPSKLPDSADLKNLSNLDLVNILSKFGIVEPWQSQVSDAMGYVTRLTTYPVGSDRWKAEVDKLLDYSSTDVLRSSVRAAYHEYTLALTDTSGLLVRICEDDESTCDVCRGLGGMEGTIDEHRAAGLPGAQSCLGGNRCRCVLVAVDEK